MDSPVRTYTIRYADGTEFKGLTYSEVSIVYTRELEAGIPCDIHPETTPPWGNR